MFKYDIYFHGILCLDRILRLDAAPCDEKNAHVLEETICPGGDATNSAHAAARLGLKVILHPNQIGRDKEGRLLTATLKKRGHKLIDLPLVSRRTPHAYILALPDGQRQVIGNFGKKVIQQPRLELLKRSRAFCFDNFFGAASQRAAKMARRSGLTVFANDIYPHEPHFPLCDFVILSSPIRNVNEAKRLLQKTKQRTKGAVIVTMGRNGSMAIDQVGKFYRQTGFKTEVVDSTGAGDCFRSAFIFSFLKNREMQSSLRFAGAFAALSCRGLGATGYLPSIAETERFAGK